MLPIIVRKIVSLLLACTSLLWCCGCSTAKQIDLSQDLEGKEITINTKDGHTYQVKEWKLLDNGGIEGKGKELVGVPKRGKRFEGIIPANNLASVTCDELNVIFTVLDCAFVVGFAIMLVVVPKGSGGMF